MVHRLVTVNFDTYKTKHVFVDIDENILHISNN